MPLLAVLLLCTAAAASPEQEAVLAARRALDRAEFPKAQSIIDDALSRYGKHDNESVLALRVLRVELVMSQGTLADATNELKTFTLPPKYGHTATAVHWLMMRALATWKADLLDQAEVIAREHHPALLADIYMYRASITADPSYAKKALRLAREHNRPVIEAKAMTNLAYGLFTDLRFAEGIEIGEQAVAMAKKHDLPKLRQVAEGNLGWAYFELGDYETAEELFRSAEKTTRDINARRDRPVWLVQLGNIESQKRNWKRAIEYNTEAADVADKVERKDQLGYALANLARIAIGQGRYEEAAAFNQRALAVKKGDPDAVLSSQVVDARIAAHTGHPDRARALFESVIKRKTKAFGIRIEAELYFAQLLVSTGSNDEARQHFEQAVRIAHEGRDEIKDRELRLAFFNTVADTYDAYVDFLIRTKHVYEALRVTESSRAQSLGEGRAVPPVFDPREVARANDATILCYWLGRERSYVWVVTPAVVKVRALPRDSDVDTMAEEYRKALLGPDAKASVARGKELFRLLVPVRLPKNARVIVVADGQLHTLNFETLVTPETRYWIEDVVVLNASSLQLVARNSKKATPSPSLLLIGNPISFDPSLPALTHAAAEIDKVAAHFTRRVILQGAQATPAAFKAEARTPYDFVHFVAHGVATRKRPLDSAIILSAPNEGTSSRLLAREVVEQPLDARLVTISSCHGAGTRTYAGEGVVGLAWAFLKAGADQVIAALWEVDDAATPALMDEMYAEIRKGRDPADALRTAKLRLVRSKSVHRYPRYWAPFVLYAGT
jgi:tetratricopeptide (TPR) repeat protein